MISEILYILFIVLLFGYLGIVIVIGSIFLIRAYITRLKSLLYGGISFVLVAISQVGRYVLGFTIFVETIFFHFHYFFAIFFIKDLFYKDKKSTFRYLLVFTFITSIIINMLVYFKMDNRTPEIHYSQITIDFFTRFFIFFWLAWASYSSYQEFKGQNIEPWIKMRYKITSIIALLISLYNLNRFFIPWNVNSGDPDVPSSFIVFGVTSILSLIISIGFYLAWTTPKWYKKILNRNFLPLQGEAISNSEVKEYPALESEEFKALTEKKYAETGIIEVVKYLGDKLSEKIYLSAPATRGLLKLAIKDNIGPFKSMNQLDYKKLKNVIQVDLMKRMNKLKIENMDEIIDYLLNELIKSQSLITMSNF